MCCGIGAGHLGAAAFNLALRPTADAQHLDGPIVGSLGCAGLGRRLRERGLRGGNTAARVAKVIVVEQRQSLPRLHRLANSDLDGLDAAARRRAQLHHAKVIEGDHSWGAHDPRERLDFGRREVQVHVVQSGRRHVDATGRRLRRRVRGHRHRWVRYGRRAVAGLEPSCGRQQGGRSHKEYDAGLAPWCATLPKVRAHGRRLASASHLTIPNRPVNLGAKGYKALSLFESRPMVDPTNPKVYRRRTP
jgi:hypothetical protein